MVYGLEFMFHLLLSHFANGKRWHDQPSGRWHSLSSQCRPLKCMRPHENRSSYIWRSNVSVPVGMCACLFLAFWTRCTDAAKLTLYPYSVMPHYTNVDHWHEQPEAACMSVFCPISCGALQPGFLHNLSHPVFGCASEQKNLYLADGGDAMLGFWSISYFIYPTLRISAYL